MKMIFPIQNHTLDETKCYFFVKPMKLNKIKLWNRLSEEYVLRDTKELSYYCKRIKNIFTVITMKINKKCYF